MERPAWSFGFAFLVERVGNGGGVGIEFDDRVDGRTALVDLVDSRRILLDQRAP